MYITIYTQIYILTFISPHLQNKKGPLVMLIVSMKTPWKV